jgi:hypothetical protein
MSGCLLALSIGCLLLWRLHTSLCHLLLALLFSLLSYSIMGKNKKGGSSSHHSGDKRKREPTPPLEDFGDSEYSEEEFSFDSKGPPVYTSPPASFDDSDDSQGIAAEVWTYIWAVERSGLEGSDESEVSSDEKNSSDSSEEGSGGDGNGEGDSDDEGDSKGDGSKGDDKGDDGSSRASGKAPLA